MTYKEYFGNAENFGKYMAQRMLSFYDEYGVIYYNGNVEINLIDCPECYLSDEMKIKKNKAIENIKYLKDIINGKIIDWRYEFYYNHVCDNEFIASGG